MNLTAEQPGWNLVGEPRYVQGYMHGFAHPSIVVAIRMSKALSPAVADDLERHLSARLPRLESGDPAGPEMNEYRYGATRFLAWMKALRLLAYAPIDVPGQVFAVDADSVSFVVPCEVLARDIQKALIKAMIALIDTAIRGGDLASPLDQVAVLHGRLAESCAHMGNGFSFFRTAVTRGLPVRELPGGILQYGIGSASRRMAGALTDATSVIAMRLARDKRLAAQVLAQSGVPVPAQRTAETVEQAVAFAQVVGYPVVVKPADLDGGKGVAARLENADEVTAAFAQCRKLSPNVIVEKFIEGRDYRIEVLNDEVMFVVERVPGHVVGNGIDTIATLIERLNADPQRSDGPKPPLGKLLLDEEAMRWMHKRGFDPQSILPSGEFLRLRGAANTASGGTPVDVLALAHPDNLALAVRAAQAIRLDIAGIDLIIPDIARSWRETGGAICEVNASPNLGLLTSTPCYNGILERMLPRGGRIPVVLIIGASDPAELAQEVSAALFRRGLNAGCHFPEGIRIGKKIIAQGHFKSAAAGNLLALDMTVDAIILCMNDTSPAETGLPVDRYDVLLLAGREVSGAGGVNALLSAVLPACTGAVIPIGDGGDVPQQVLPAGIQWSNLIERADLSSELQAVLNFQPDESL